MRKLIVLSFITLDGVMQAPGGPEEDTSGGFQHGGWTFHYFDEFMGNVMDRQMSRPFDLLLGRRTYDIFASYWPNHHDPNDPVSSGLNNSTKYVVSHSPGELKWNNTIAITGDVVKAIDTIKKDSGPDLHVHGSSNLIQTLLRHNLADEFWLKIFPITLGKGKRLFDSGAMPSAFTASDIQMSPKGVIVATYKRSGEVITGSFGD